MQAASNKAQEEEMSNFWEGFEKKALQPTLKRELALGAGAELVPFGTTAHTAVADRPKDHSRSQEWLRRVLMSGIGATLGAAFTPKKREAVGALIGATLGGIVGHRSAVGPYYDENGKLIKEEEASELKA